MEKIRIFIFSFIILLVGILVFSLTKSWLVYDRGIQVIPAQEEKEREEDPDSAGAIDKKESIENWQENSRIYWKNALLYPLGSSTESGGLGPDGVMNHARNLIAVHLQSGKSKKLFPKNVYIWDYFQADFQKRSGFSASDVPNVESIHLPGKVLIFAATIDTNQDGFLNHKDRKKIFLYDTEKDKLVEVLPEESFFEKLLWNAGDNRLALVIRNRTLINEEKENYEFSSPLFFIYDASLNRRSTVEIIE